MVRLCSQHALDVVPDIAKYDAESFWTVAAGRSLGLEGLDLETLHNRHREAAPYSGRVVEDGPVDMLEKKAFGWRYQDSL